MPVTETVIRGLSQKDVAFARSSSAVGSPRKTALHIQVNGKTVPAGSYIDKVVQTCLVHVAEGHTVAVMPVDEEIGTQEAADLLKVSRPYLIKLLEADAIPSRKVGVQRRLKIEDILAYKTKERSARKRVLAKLAAESQRLDLGE